MADVLRTLLIVGALVASARARYVAGVVLAAACALVLAVETFFALRFPLPSGRIEIAFGAIFLGPTAMPHAPPFAASQVLMDPTHHVVTALIAALGARVAFRRASALPPDGLPSRRLDRAALRFVALAVLAAIESIPGVLGHLLGDVT